MLKMEVGEGCKQVYVKQGRNVEKYCGNMETQGNFETSWETLIAC